MIVEEICPKCHTSRRRCRDPTVAPCRQCEQERKADEVEASRQDAAKRRREEQLEEAAARLAAVRRGAAVERERVAHERALLRLEADTQRAELDAEEARAAAAGVRAKVVGARAQRNGQTPATVVNGGDDGGRASGTKADERRKEINRQATRREDELDSRFQTLPKPAIGTKPSKTTTDSPPQASKTSRNSKKGRESTEPAENAKQSQLSFPGTTGLPVSTLLLVAQAAHRGDARGINAALDEVPKTEWERSSHQLALAVGERAVDWFPPLSPVDEKSGKSEPKEVKLQPIATRPGRAVQALGMMSAGEFVQARRILVAIAKEDEGLKLPPQSRQPHVVFALALCDYYVGGVSTATEILAKLDVAERELWSGPPDGPVPPSARSFPLGALVHATLEAEIAAASSSDDAPDADDDNDTTDPMAQACASAIAFLRAPDDALKLGGVASARWVTAAEGVVAQTGKALAAALWGPEGGGSGDEKEDGRENKKPPGEIVKIEWRKLQSKSGIESPAMDELLEMSGLDSVKARFLNVARSAVLDRDRGYDLAARSYNVRMEGNPGTGEFSGRG